MSQCTIPMISAAKLGLILLMSYGVAAEAAEIKVIASTGVAGVVSELGRQFEAATGHKVQTDFAVIAVSRRNIDAGAAFDIAILGPGTIDELIGQGKIARPHERLPLTVRRDACGVPAC